MHTKNYLNIALISYTDSSEIAADSVSIIICSSENDLKQFEPRPILVNKIKAAMEEKKGSILSFFAEKQYLIVVNASDEVEKWRVTGANLYKKLKKEKIKNVHISGLTEMNSSTKVGFLEGLLLGSYEFTKYKKETKLNLCTVSVADSSITEIEIKELNVLANAVSFVKTLVNEPVNFLDALKFSEITVQAGKTFGFKTEILHKKEIETLKMGGLLGVNQGSVTPPTFNIMKYKPANAINTKPLTFSE